MSIGLIGRKVGMTSIFADDGTMVPVSVVAIAPNTVTRLRTHERDGYTAIQLGAGEVVDPELAQGRRQAGALREVLELARARLVQLGLLVRPELDRRVAVTLGRAQAGDRVRGDLQHGDGHHRAVGLEHLRHPGLAPDESDHRTPPRKPWTGTVMVCITS